MEKEGRRDDRYIDGYNPVCTLGVLQRTRKFLQVLTISPRICRACRPTPCPHSACECNACGVHSPKLGGAGGSPLILPWDGKIADLRANGAKAALLAVLRCSAGRTGSAGYAADRTPAGAGARPRTGAPVVAVCRQMRGCSSRGRQ
jgi:hypothetical protein